MKKAIVTVILLCGMFLAGAALAENYDSIVKVEAPILDSNKVWSGVGFFVTENLIVTCSHIIHGDKRDYVKNVSIILRDKRYKVEVLDSDKKMDIALLHLKKPLGTPWNICDTSIPGQNVVINYIDENLDINGRTGRIEKLYMDSENFADILVKVKVKPGNSGSPVIRNNCVVGMIQRQSGFSLGARNIRVFLELHGVVK